MTPLFNKLSLGDHRDIVVIDAPASFGPELAALSDVKVRRRAGKSATLSFAIIFVRTLAEVEAAAGLLANAVGDAIIWFAYPKGTSKRYQCEFNRDTGWESVRAAGFDAVRQVAIDEDWSALRFRRVEYIKK
jgi:hypothetical protein